MNDVGKKRDDHHLYNHRYSYRYGTASDTNDTAFLDIACLGIATFWFGASIMCRGFGESTRMSGVLSLEIEVQCMDRRSVAAWDASSSIRCSFMLRGNHYEYQFVLPPLACFHNDCETVVSARSP